LTFARENADSVGTRIFHSHVTRLRRYFITRRTRSNSFCVRKTKRGKSLRVTYRISGPTKLACVRKIYEAVFIRRHIFLHQICELTVGHLRGLVGSALDTYPYHMSSNLGMSISEGCFIFDFASLPLEVARPI